MESMKERLLQLISSLNVSVRSFERNIGVSNGYVSGLRESMSLEKVSALIDCYPTVNKIWLLTGEGEMFVNDSAKDEPLHTTKLVPLRAIGGALSGVCDDGVTLEGCEDIVSPIAGVDCAITVYGDSMSPDYPSGSRVLLKKVDPDLFLEWGKVYVIDTPNGIIIKEVRKGERDGYIECHSRNAGKYAPFEVPVSAVYGFYRVLMVMTMM